MKRSSRIPWGMILPALLSAMATFKGMSIHVEMVRGAEQQHFGKVIVDFAKTCKQEER